MVGPNAAGKSNLLDAFRFLHDVASADGGLQRAVLDRRGLDAIRFLGAAADAEVVVHVIVADEDVTWTYLLAFSGDAAGKAVLTRERVLCNQKLVFDRPDDDDVRDSRRLRQTSIEQVAMNRAFRPIADFLGDLRYLHLSPELLRRPTLILPGFEDPAGSDLIHRLVQLPRPLLQQRMQRLNAVLRVALPQLDRIDIENEPGKTPHLRVRFTNWRPTAPAQNEQQLSDGTLRLVGFLWALLDGTGPLLLEEPELSLHPGVVRRLASLARAESPRQTIISTHSLDFLSDEGIAAEEVLLLEPTSEGTRVRVASDDQQIRALLEGGLSIGEAVLPSTAPPRSTDTLRVVGES